jgi:hypothetical protein
MTRKQQDEPSWLENYFEGVITNDAPVWRWSGVDDFGDALQREILYNLTTHNSLLGHMARAAEARRNQ